VQTVSILLLTKNGSRDLRDVLSSIYSQEGVKPLEVIVIDSESSDGTLDIAREFQVRIEKIPAKSFHHARTRNFAARLAYGNLLVFLSQDAIPASVDWLASLLKNFDDPSVGAVYGRQIPKPGSSPERVEVLQTLYGAQRLVKDPVLQNDLGYRFYHFSDVNAAIRRDVWEKTQFPEHLKVFEDLGIAKRILDSGMKIVYEPSACVFHSHQHSTIQLFRRYFDIGYTLNYLQIWKSPGVGASLAKDGRASLLSALARFKSAKATGQGALIQQLAKSVGFFLGLKQEFLPLVLKKRFSAHGVYSEVGK
jgi:glycosyltransferase involved in cell wall biosynthesis